LAVGDLSQPLPDCQLQRASRQLHRHIEGVALAREVLIELRRETGHSPAAGGVATRAASREADGAHPELARLHRQRPKRALVDRPGARLHTPIQRLRPAVREVPRVYRAPAGERRSWTNPTTAAPSPTAVAQRLIEPARTSPAA